MELPRDLILMKTKNIIYQCFGIVFSSGLLACASGPDAPGSAAESVEARGSDCILQSSVRDYRVLDDANLIVTAAAQRKYHVLLSRRALGLRSSWQIGFRSPTGQICAGFGDVVVDDGFGPERIRIDSIRRLTPDDEEELLIRFGKKEPEHRETPAPVDVDGAEVEELD
jgi:hypothetical protein